MKFGFNWLSGFREENRRNGGRTTMMGDLVARSPTPPGKSTPKHSVNLLFTGVGRPPASTFNECRVEVGDVIIFAFRWRFSS